MGTGMGYDQYLNGIWYCTFNLAFEMDMQHNE